MNLSASVGQFHLVSMLKVVDARKHQNVETAAADLEGGRDGKESSESSKAQAKSPRTCIEEAEDRGVGIVYSESSDEDSVSNETFLEGLPVPSSDNDTNLSEEATVVTRDPPACAASTKADGMA